MDQISFLLSRGVNTIYPSKEALEKVLRSGKKIKLYQGFDPSGTRLHIGHAVGLRKLRQFQELGHQVIFLIGDFTGMIGDPSGKLNTRKILTQEQVLENASQYQKQASKVLDFQGSNPVQIVFNSQWNAKLTFADILKLTGYFSVPQIIERDMFQERLKKGQEISLVEFMYPVMQAYDAVSMKVDLELGGTDQTFNMLAGRDLMRKMLGKEKYVMTVPLLTDNRGVKIGKTEGNVIALTDAANDFYAKIMSLGDDSIVACFTLLTNMPEAEIEQMKQMMVAGENPMSFKKKLAFELTKQFNNELAAGQAQVHFESLFQKLQIPSTIPAFEISGLSQNPLNIVKLLIETGSCDSNAQARRLIEQKAVEIDQTIVDITNTNISLTAGMALRVGKKKFLKFI